MVLRCILSLFLLMREDLMQLRSAVDVYAQLQSLPALLAKRDDPLFPGDTVLKVRRLSPPHPPIKPCDTHSHWRRPDIARV
jgi:hypothetical protein